MSQKKEVILGADGKPMYELITKPHAEQAFMWQPVYGGTPLFRVGFLSPVPPRHLEDPEYIHDSRPIAWPLYHPYWIVRMSHDANMLMAYVESIDDVTTFWPEATEITVFEEGVTKYMFNADFQKPSWLDEVQSPDFVVKPPRIGAFRIINTETEEVLYGYSDDVEYAVQLQSHKLLYGVHEDKEFQDNLVNYDALSPTIHPAATLAAAEKLARDLQEFNEDKGELPTTLYIGDDE